MTATETILDIQGLTSQKSKTQNLLEIKDQSNLIHYNNLLNQLKVSIQIKEDFVNINFKVYFLIFILDLLVFILKV